MTETTPVTGHRPKPASSGRPASIRRRLALTLMASTGLLWAAITAFGLYGVRHEAREISDAQLSLAGHVLLTMLVHEIQEGYADPSHAIGLIVPDIFPTGGHPHVDPPLGVDRATHLITQLLTLARIDHRTRTHTNDTIDLLEVVHDLCMEISPRALDAGIELKPIGKNRCPVSVERTLLTILVRNLIENAIQYGGSGKQITIGVQCVDQRAILSVRDQGPGIPPQDLDRVFERFYRSTNQYAPGSGLGLSIVKGIADNCDAKVILSNHREGGLSVAVEFQQA